MITRSSSRFAALLALPLLAVLAGCGVATPMPSADGSEGTPSPRPTSVPEPTGTPTPVPTPTPTATAAPEQPVAPVVLATSVVITSRSVTAYAADGSTLASLGFDETDHAGAAARFAVALGAEPAVSTTGAIGTGCDADQTVYDFGGFLLRSPGYVGAIGPIEVEVKSAATASGVPITTVGGVGVGTTRAAFDTAVGGATDLSSYSGRDWVGFDRVNPDAADADAIGSIARFDAGVLAQWNGPRYLYGDC